MINYSSKEFSDPELILKDGVAEVDMMTLSIAARKIDELIDGNLLLPELANIVVPSIFSEISDVEVIQDDSIRVRVTIDTKKAKWTSDNVQKSAFEGYDGKSYYGVRFFHIAVLNEQTAIIPIKLGSEGDVLMWVMETSKEKLGEIKLYELYEIAKNIISGYSADLVKNFDEVTIPAQQIKYERNMSEIAEPNKVVLKGGEVTHRAYVALDETGVRVKAVTEMLVRSWINPSPKLKVFGQSGPVVFWFTEKDINKETLPFAVFATTSEAWIDQDTKISFEDKEFTHE